MIREQIALAAQHKGGLKLHPCLAVDPEWFGQIQQDIRLLLEAKAPSDVSDKSHPTNWTNPYGNVTQHSLWNESGSTADTTTDHNLKIEGKSFAATEYLSLKRFFAAFQSRALNFRMNGMMPGSGLSPHEENIVHANDQIRVRFHLPIFTNEQAHGMLDGEQFHMRAGYIYYFNNGCVHAASNYGSAARYHLVWDMWLDEWVQEHMFNLSSPASPAEGLRKLTAEEARQLSVSTPWIIDEYVNYRGETVKVPQAAQR